MDGCGIKSVNASEFAQRESRIGTHTKALLFWTALTTYNVHDVYASYAAVKANIIQLS